MKLSKHSTHSGVGGAHFGLFGRSLVLREGEGDGAGGTGTTTPPEASGTPATPPGGNKTFSQDEVNRIAAQAREDGRRSASKASPQTQAATPGDDGDRPTLKQLQARLDESELRRAFDKRAGRLGLEDDAADDLFELYKAQKPENPQAWFDAKVSRFGLKAPTASTPNPTTQQQLTSAPATPAAPPAAAPAAPNRVESPVGPDGLVNIYAMSAEQFAQMTPPQIRQHHEANLSRAISATGAPPAPRIPGQQQNR